jgi:3-phenylpropionate/cinnamic acid dioxygenase small subunit
MTMDEHDDLLRPERCIFLQPDEANEKTTSSRPLRRSIFLQDDQSILEDRVVSISSQTPQTCEQLLHSYAHPGSSAYYGESNPSYQDDNNSS